MEEDSEDEIEDYSKLLGKNLNDYLKKVNSHLEAEKTIINAMKNMTDFQNNSQSDFGSKTKSEIEKGSSLERLYDKALAQFD